MFEYLIITTFAVYLGVSVVPAVVKAVAALVTAVTDIRK